MTRINVLDPGASPLPGSNIQVLPFSAGAHAGLAYLLMGPRGRSTTPAPRLKQQDFGEEATAPSGGPARG
ncbi:hypothetical protein ACGFZG_24620 [Streptomyces antibioticus]|uniref:hypothetical protein n=1 Tax=Streptomyces antibioticus TaxID=1890 RepID=UPI0036F94FBF